jgi:hypothetical protein
MSCSGIFEFYPEEDRKLSLRLKERDQDGCVEPFSIPAGSEVTVTLLANPSNIVLNKTTTPPVVVDNEALGYISIELTTAQLSQMVDGSIKVFIEDSKKVAIAASAVKKLKVPDC